MAGTVTINGFTWSVDFATTPAERATGLGGVTSLPSATGMLFDMGSSQIITVTTVPMLFNLDVVFIGESNGVVACAHDVAPGQVFSSPIPARYFLEVNAGEAAAVSAGNTVSITGLPVNTGQDTSILTTLVDFVVIFAMMYLMSNMMKWAAGEKSIKEIARGEWEKAERVISRVVGKSA